MWRVVKSPATTGHAGRPMDLSTVSFPDYLALAVFAIAWTGYSLLVDHGPLSTNTLSNAMDKQRRIWVEQMQLHEVRIADTNILGGLQNGNAFFASASMLAIGACLAALGAGDELFGVISDIDRGTDETQRALLDAKMIGLALIFVYAFFKFSWGYRLIVYASVLVGALPPPAQKGMPETTKAIERAARFLRLAGYNFNRGQRAFYFALAFLGWIVSPWALLAGTAGVIAVLAHRQFWSQPAKAMA